jgi:hypothetical protein
MIRSTVVLYVLLGAIASAQAQPTCDPTSFQNKAVYLNTPISPGISTTPPAGSSLPSGSTYAADLGAAFCAGSADFRTQLSKLEKVYVIAASCSDSVCLEGSWGWSHGGKWYIGLSEGLWGSGFAYSQYETALTQGILSAAHGVKYNNAQSCAGCGAIDTFTTALVAILAHEMGHIGYYSEVPSSTPANFCSGKFFTSWDPNTVNPPPYWRYLLTPSGRDTIRGGPTGKWPYKHKKNPGDVDVIDHPGAGSSPKQLIYYLVAPDDTATDAGAPWASPLAAMSPDEDFVETYKLKVLLSSTRPLTSVTIDVPGVGTADIVGGLKAGKRKELSDKLDCVSVQFN